MKQKFDIIKPYLLTIVLFLAISYTYYSPVLQGKVVNQSDISQFLGSAKSLKDYVKEYDEHSLWNDAMFSGMPAERYAPAYGNKIDKLRSLLQSGKRPASYLFVALLCFFILLRTMGVKHWLATIGAIAFGFTTYLFIIIEAGHNAKMLAIAYMPLIIAGILMAFRGKRLVGAALFGLGVSFQIAANHIQITYYLIIVVIVFGIFELVDALKKHTLPDFLKTIALLIFVALLGAAANTNRLWLQQEYVEYTMRGGSELASKHDGAPENKTKEGLDKDYATRWSYGREETLNLLIPNLKGGSSMGELSEKSATYNLYKKSAGASQAKKAIKRLPLYWGDQPFTSGPMYIGAIAFLLFIFSLVVVKGKLKWWLLASTVLVIFIGWGRHMMWFQSLLLDYLPLYSKFRSPSMILAMAGFTVPLLGIMGLNQLINGEVKKEEALKGLKIAAGSLGAICLLFIVFPSLAGNFTNAGDARYPKQLVDALMADRKSLLITDAFRSLVFILLGSITLLLFINKKIKTNVLLISFAVLFVFDLWPVGKRFMNEDDFMDQKKFEKPFPIRPVDKEILKDNDPYYRVLDLSTNTFNDNYCSYYHKSIGGYSAEKLMRYQEMIDYHILPEIQSFAKGLKGVKTSVELNALFASMDVLNMLNTKYIISNANGKPMVNTSAMGNAWFVDDYKIVNTPDEEITALYQIKPQTTAVINAEFQDQIKPITKDGSASIRLTHYKMDDLQFEYQAAAEQLVVFSDIYHNLGWQAYIDGKEVDHLRVDYVLRALFVPAGKHTIEWKYSSHAYIMGNRISLISSLLLYLFLIISILPLKKIIARFKK